MNLFSLVIITLLIEFCVSQGSGIEEKGKLAGDECVIKETNTTGVLKQISDCTSLTNTTFEFQENTSIICCATTTTLVNQSRRISELKCDEYKELLQAKGVVGGVDATFAEFPHMALIGWTNIDNETDWNCGGTLISENFVLTAGHCTSNNGNPPSTVRLGEHNLKESSSNFKLDEFNIKNIITHPNYSFLRVYNDIALVELDGIVTIRKTVRPACLYQKFETEQTSAIATGWGKLSHGGEQSSILQKVNLSLVPNTECSTSYHKTRKLRNGIIDTQICYGHSDGGKDTCQGDSGGPIQIRNNYNGKYVYDIIGVTSFGSFCGSTTPGVYTRIFSYLDWIESVVWK